MPHALTSPIIATCDDASTALDRREHDANGYMLVRDNPLTKEGVFPYRGREIGAPEPDRIYYVYRPASELSKPETIASFNLLPLIDNHEMLGKGATPAEQKVPQGYTGESATFDGTYLRNTIRVVSTRLQELIARGKVELSPGYRCKYVFESGRWNGQAYDAIQTQIFGNHLALVDQGRTGPDVAILDAYPFGIDDAEETDNEEAMKFFTEEQVGALRALGYDDEQIAAMDAALFDLDAAEEEREEAEDSAGGDTKPAAKPEIGAPQKPAESHSDGDKRMTLAEEIVSLLTSRLGEQGASRSTEDTASVSMDAVMRNITRRDKLAHDLRPYLGVFDTSDLLSEAAVAEYACKKLGLRVDAKDALGAVRGYLHSQAAHSIKQQSTTDSAPSTGALSTHLWG